MDIGLQGMCFCRHSESDEESSNIKISHPVIPYKRSAIRNPVTFELFFFRFVSDPISFA